VKRKKPKTTVIAPGDITGENNAPDLGGRGGMTVDTTLIQSATATFKGVGEQHKFPGRVFEPPKERLKDAPGRPSSAALVIEEARRRLASDIVRGPLYRFCDKLSKWVRETHSDNPPMDAKTIERHIRKNLRAEWEARKKD
jgi:hypothetical protein